MFEWFAMVALAGVPAKPGVDGGLPLAWVDEVIAWSSTELAACFPPKSKRTSIHYTFDVSPSGRVERMSLGEVKGEWERVTCVGTVVESLSFPSVDAGTTVSWLFTASPVRDAGVSEERVLDAADVPAAWTEDVTYCLASPTKVTPGRITVSLDTSAFGFALSSQVSAPAGPEHDGVVRCVSDAARGWRVASGRRERLTASWVNALSEREVKKFFDPSAPAVEIVVGSAPVVSRRGGLLKSVILQEMRRHEPRVRACQQLMLGRDPSSNGMVRLHFTIGPEGDVIDAEPVENTTDDANMEQCLLGVVKAMRFPKPEGGGKVEVTFPWIFVTRGE